MNIKKLFLNDIIFQSMIKLIIMIFKHLKSNLQLVLLSSVISLGIWIRCEYAFLILLWIYVMLNTTILGIFVHKFDDRYTFINNYLNMNSLNKRITNLIRKYQNVLIIIIEFLYIAACIMFIVNNLNAELDVGINGAVYILFLTIVAAAGLCHIIYYINMIYDKKSLLNNTRLV